MLGKQMTAIAGIGTRTRNTRLTTLGFCALLVLSACSARQQYIAPIDKFASTVTDVETILADYNMSIHDTILEQRIASGIENPMGVTKKNGSCELQSSECVLQICEQKDCEPLFPRFPLENTLALMAEFKKYVQGMKAVAEADTQTKVDASIDRVQANLLKLVSLTKNGEKSEATTGISEIAQAAGAIVKRVAGAYLDDLKLDALKRASHAADPIVQKTATAFKVRIKEMKRFEETRIVDALDDLEEKFETNKTDRALRQWLGLSQAFNLYLEQKPARIFNAFAKAHSELNKALNGDLSFEEALKFMEEARDSAEALLEATSSLRKALQTPRSSPPLII